MKHLMRFLHDNPELRTEMVLGCAGSPRVSERFARSYADWLVTNKLAEPDEAEKLIAEHRDRRHRVLQARDTWTE